jgi:hypothetical protein
VELGQLEAELMRRSVGNLLDKRRKPSTGSFDFAVSADGKSLTVMERRRSAIPVIDLGKCSALPGGKQVKWNLDCCWKFGWSNTKILTMMRVAKLTKVGRM